MQAPPNIIRREERREKNLRKQTQAVSGLYTNTDNLAVNINVPFRVSHIIIKTFIFNNIDSSNTLMDPLVLVQSDLLPPVSRYLMAVSASPTATIPVSGDRNYNPYCIVPSGNLVFYYDEPVQIQGVYNFKLVNYAGATISDISAIDAYIFIQIEYCE